MKKLTIFVSLFVLILASAALAVESPIPNSGFETGDLSGWQTNCGGSPASACNYWTAEVGTQYAYAGEYGLRLSNTQKVYHWSTASIFPIERFTDNSDSYTIPVKLIKVGNYYGSVMFLIGDSQGYVRYRGSTSTSIAGCPPDIPFKMALNQWKEYTFNFRADYYKKYSRYPDSDRRLVLYVAEDYWAGGSEMWVDNVLGEPAAPCTDNDADGYSVEGGDCGLVDCDDSDSNVIPGASVVTDSNYPWGNVGECKEEISECDGTTGEMIVVQEKIGPDFETCDGKDNDCNSVIDDLDEDEDGVYDCGEDFCPGSVFDNVELNPNHYAQIDSFDAFEIGENHYQSLVYTMAETKGCTCSQLALNLGAQSSKGCAPGLMEEWTGLDSTPDREYNKKGGNKVTGKFTEALNGEAGLLYILTTTAIIALATVAIYALRKK